MAPRQRSLTWLAPALLLLLCGADAYAAGFYLPGRGVRPLGRAGAFVASGEGDLNSLWYNPANLATLADDEELSLTVDLALIGLDFDFQRAPRAMPDGTLRTYEPVSNEAPPKPDPQVLIGGATGVEGLAWSFGAYAPYLAGHTFPEQGPQRYTLVDNDSSLLLFLHAAAAYDIGEHIRVGVGLQNVVARFDLVTVTSAYTGLYGDPEDEDLDILTRVTVEDLFAPSANAGAWVRLAPMLEAGLSVQLPVAFHDSDAALQTRLPSNAAFAGAEIEGDAVAASFSFPAVIRLALRYDQPRFDVELAGVYEGWSIFDEIEATPDEVAVSGVPGIGAIPIGPLAVPMGWQDAFSVRLGSDQRWSESLTTRAGYAFETAAVPDERYSVYTADATKHVLTLGGSWAMNEALTVDLSLAYYGMVDRTITNSEVTQINPTDDERELVIVVGNGEYQQTYYAAGIGTNWRF